MGFVGQKMLGQKTVDQSRGLAAIGRGALGDDHSHRQTVSIDSQMQFGVQAAFGAGKVLVPPFAPAAGLHRPLTAAQWDRGLSANSL